MNAPHQDTLRIQAFPSAVFEMVHVGFRLTPRVRRHKRSLWIEEIAVRRPDLASSLLTFWSDEYHVGLELPILASSYGFAHDEDAGRFLASLPELAVRYHRMRPTLMPSALRNRFQDDEDQHLMEIMDQRIAQLNDSQTMSDYKALWQEVWHEIRPIWQREGLAQVQKEVARINNDLAEGQHTLEVLPQDALAHHDEHRERIDAYGEEGFVVINPLFFVGMGGHAVDIGESLFLGYGLHSRQLSHQLEQRSQQLSQRIKALADPTRLMILSLVSEFQHNITVGDLAKRFGVSQPTISGHLKILRDVDLVMVKREGNRAYYHADHRSIVHLMLEVEHLILPAKDIPQRDIPPNDNSLATRADNTIQPSSSTKQASSNPEHNLSNLH